MKALSVHQPRASFQARGIYTMETRDNPPAGPMCPKGVRPLPGFALKQGERIAIAATKHVVEGHIGPYYVEPYYATVNHVEDCYCEVGEVEPRCAARTKPSGYFYSTNGMNLQPLPLGAVVAVATLVDCVPMLGPDDDFDGACLVVDGDALTWWWPAHGFTEADERDVSDQRPYGDFTPGRWAWLLADVRPLSTPIPVRGRQGVWDWPDGDHLDLAVTVRPDNQGDTDG